MGDQQELQDQHPEEIHQNPIEYPSEYSSDPPDFSLLRLHSSPAAVHRRQCSGHSRKRPSPASASFPAKKLFLDRPPEHCLLRSASDPDPFHASFSAPAPKLSAVSPRSLPPRPPTLRRAGSAPMPNPLSRTSSSASGETDNTPNSKTSNMLSHWRQINLWMEDLMRQDQDSSENPTTTTTTTEDHSNENDAENVLTDTSEAGSMLESFPLFPFEFSRQPNSGVSQEDCTAELEESLSVEKDGDRLHIHFNCHCGKGYQFLLADGNCFYKLL